MLENTQIVHFTRQNSANYAFKPLNDCREQLKWKLFQIYANRNYRAKAVLFIRLPKAMVGKLTIRALHDKLQQRLREFDW